MIDVVELLIDRNEELDGEIEELIEEVNYWSICCELAENEFRILNNKLKKQTKVINELKIGQLFELESKRGNNLLCQVLEVESRQV